MEIYSALQNAYPTVQSRTDDIEYTYEELECSISTPIDDREVFDHIRDIKDPEHPLTLEELGVVELEKVKVIDRDNECCVTFTPTIPHCSMATLIGLSIKVQLIRILPRRFKVEVKIEPGTHSQENAINKQLADKERVAAALENSHLIEVINDCLLLPKEQEFPESVQRLLKGKDLANNSKVKYILQSRQPVTTFKRWLEIVNEHEKYNFLINSCKSLKIGCCGGSNCS